MEKGGLGKFFGILGDEKALAVATQLEPQTKVLCAATMIVDDDILAFGTIVIQSLSSHSVNIS